MSGSLAELWGVRHRLSLLAPGRGEVLVYLSPEVGCFLQPCFNACEAFWSHDEIDVEFLDHQFGQYDVRGGGPVRFRSEAVGGGGVVGDYVVRAALR